MTYFILEHNDNKLYLQRLFRKSILGFQFWTFINVHFSKPI
jgi:hypothetical protein